MISREILVNGADAFNLALSEEEIAKINTYSRYLVDYNEKVNLTAITEPDEIAIRHFVDSMAVSSLVKIPTGSAMIDVGSGAGFPGVPLKMIRPDLQLTLLDSLKKRLDFLSELSDKIDISYQLVHMRAETAGIDPAFRARFDIATARAVAQLSVLSEYCLPLLKIGGMMLALKGPDCQDEIQRAKGAITLLGGKLEQTIDYRLPDQSGRTMIVIRKTAKTPAKYPRQRVKLNEKPL